MQKKSKANTLEKWSEIYQTFVYYFTQNRRGGVLSENNHPVIRLFENKYVLYDKKIPMGLRNTRRASRHLQRAQELLGFGGPTVLLGFGGPTVLTDISDDELMKVLAHLNCDLQAISMMGIANKKFRHLAFQEIERCIFKMEAKDLIKLLDDKLISEKIRILVHSKLESLTCVGEVWNIMLTIESPTFSRTRSINCPNHPVIKFHVRTDGIIVLQDHDVNEELRRSLSAGGVREDPVVNDFLEGKWQMHTWRWIANSESFHVHIRQEIAPLPGNQEDRQYYKTLVIKLLTG